MVENSSVQPSSGAEAGERPSKSPREEKEVFELVVVPCKGCYCDSGQEVPICEVKKRQYDSYRCTTAQLIQLMVH